MINFVHIHYASQSGTAAMLADKLSNLLKVQNINSRVETLNQCNLNNIELNQALIIICATTGNGDMPDTGIEFFTKIQDSNQNLSSLKYALLALGDSGFESFCGAGRDLNIEFKRLGAKAMLPRTDCDGPAEIFFTPWAETLVKVLQSD
jgi:sulfite reductase (NADPH) flavoprotein alpha-component